jgi:hypothetical protein
MPAKKTNTYLKYFFYGFLLLAFIEAIIILGIFGLWIPLIITAIAAAISIGLMGLNIYLNYKNSPSLRFQTKFKELLDFGYNATESNRFFLPHTPTNTNYIYDTFRGLGLRDVDDITLKYFIEEYLVTLAQLKYYVQEHEMTSEDIARQWDFVQKMTELFLDVGNSLDRYDNLPEILKIISKYYESINFDDRSNFLLGNPFIEFRTSEGSIFKLGPFVQQIQLMIMMIQKIAVTNPSDKDLAQPISAAINACESFLKLSFETRFTKDVLNNMDTTLKAALQKDFQDAQKSVTHVLDTLKKLQTNLAEKPVTLLTPPQPSVLSQKDSLQSQVKDYFQKHWELSFTSNKKDLRLTIHNAVIKDGAEKTCKNVTMLLNKTFDDNIASYKASGSNYATVTISSNQFQKILNHAKNNAQPLPEIKESAIKLKTGENLNIKNYLKIKHYFTTVWNLPDMTLFTDTGDLFKRFHTKEAACRYMSLINEKLGEPFTEVFKDKRFGFILYLKQESFAKLLAHIDQAEQAEQNQGFLNKLFS